MWNIGMSTWKKRAEIDVSKETWINACVGEEETNHFLSSTNETTSHTTLGSGMTADTSGWVSYFNANSTRRMFVQERTERDLVWTAAVYRVAILHSSRIRKNKHWIAWSPAVSSADSSYYTVCTHCRLVRGLFRSQGHNRHWFQFQTHEVECFMKL